MARILFSALSARRGGGLTYIRNIVSSFPRGQGHRLSVLSTKPIEGLPEHEDVAWMPAPRWTENPLLRFLFGALYFRFFWPHRHDFDIVFYAGGSFDVALPPTIRTAVAFRNMLPFDRESNRRYGWGWMRFRHGLLRHLQSAAFRRADLVIFISDFARRTIDAAVPRREGRSVVIPHGVSPSIAPLEPELAAHLPSHFVLYLSILDVYKAQLELIEAWARLRRMYDGPEKLVLVGQEYTPYARRVRAAIRERGLEDEVILLGAVHHTQIFDLMERATASLFLSACENCPNILLELMRAGQPLLVSARQPMPELGGPELDYVEPYDVAAVAEGIARLLRDPRRRARLADAARTRARLYDWDRTGALTWDAILRCADASGSSPAIPPERKQQVTHVQG